MSNSLDPDQAGHFVGADLGPNCLERLSTDDTLGKELTNCEMIVIRGVIKKFAEKCY